VQVLDGATGRSHYFAYPADAFEARDDPFEVRVGASRFARDRIELRLADEAFEACGAVRFGPWTPWPVRWRAPGAMGWYGWVPVMECYHGVLSFGHELDGAVRFGDETVRFHGGRGYVEKDWGEAFPSAYVWLQTNHFDAPDTSLSASIAMIPWRGRTFRGFIVGFRHAGALHRLATWTGARVEHLAVDDEHVDWVLADRRLRLAIRARRVEGGLLHAPVRTEMHRRVNETLSSVAFVRLTTRVGGVLFEGRGRGAGLEVHGDLATLLGSS
jgi:hypothetical protein